LRDLRGGKIGAISFERPEDHPVYREDRVEPASSPSNST
jgi:hypothetical protein